MKNKYPLTQETYNEVVNSRLVKNYLNWLDEKHTMEIKASLEGDGFFIKDNGIGYWTMNQSDPEDYEPVSMDIASFAWFLRYPINIERHRQYLMRYAQLPKKRSSVYLVLEAVSTELPPYDDCDENERAKGTIKLHLATFDESKAIKKGKSLINGKELTSYNEKRYCLGYYREYNPCRDIMILNLPFGEYKIGNYGFPLWEFKSGSWSAPQNTISNLPLLTKEKKINRAKEGNPVYLITKTTKTRTEDDDSLNDSGDMTILFATLDYGEARKFLENEQKLNKAYMYYGEHEPFFLVENEEENSNNRISTRNTISICSINTDEDFKNGLTLSSFDLYTLWS